ncbi:MAG: 2-hydroxy-3-oxopropionate reductase [Burkholderiaceae bacterium]|jgi:3-hydroxyisobutyrate dehydrogenase|nr:MAG: 2-hydroxy-3-oxopropionate reductase [Burkholderiaceae bacterium]
MTTAREAIGIVGIGNMGGAIALHLLEQGWAVRVRDLVAAKEHTLAAAGAVACASTAELARTSAVLLVCVVDAGQTREVLFGAGGAIEGLRAGQTVVLCPTIAPRDVEDCAARLAASGVAVIDAPMSGGPARARDGTMSLMVACADEVFERQRALLQTVSSRLFRVGPRPGDGARTKLVNNLAAGINLAGAAEVLALASRLGLDVAATLDVIEQSSGQSWIGSDRMRRAIGGDYAPRAHTTLLAKDTRLALETARSAGFEPALGRIASELFRRAVAEGFGEEDDASLFKLLQQAGEVPKAGLK